ncbi:hypothetical protein [Corallococcus macrosporus]|uniref:Uncharacterized protein n=1 Tax=Corallococcus macrosporus DSM 14697 TaxID=1189310 RepID=A0A250JYL1_9BACT|nr:hypothetical protein [Corallococcus macrosporus]ATB48939.1 hypothetical protein MYMAC_004572 [Corallococcus macrosporus DSM 14697]
MTVISVAALVVQLMSAGGAGAQGEQAAGRERGDPGSVSTNLSALKSEVTSLSERFKAARERRRLQAEQEKQEWEREPKTPASPGRE